jgi:hypothetical protein
VPCPVNGGTEHRVLTDTLFWRLEILPRDRADYMAKRIASCMRRLGWSKADKPIRIPPSATSSRGAGASTARSGIRKVRGGPDTNSGPTAGRTHCCRHRPATHTGAARHPINMKQVRKMVPIEADRVTDAKLASVARELAMDIDSVDDVLKAHSITPSQWDAMRRNPVFVEYLKAELAAWQSAVNVEQRVKYKASALIEMWLPIASGHLQNERDPLSGKVELAKLVAKLAGLGDRAPADTSEKVNITISLGGEDQVKIVKELPVKVIEHKPEGGENE